MVGMQNDGRYLFQDGKRFYSGRAIAGYVERIDAPNTSTENPESDKRREALSEYTVLTRERYEWFGSLIRHPIIVL